MASENDLIKFSHLDSDESDEFQITCKLCNASFSGTISFEQHLQGSKHRKEFMKKKYAEKYLRAKAELEGENHVDKVNYEEDTNVYTCHTCKRICTGYVPYKLHLASKSHAKKEKNAQLMEEMKDELQSAHAVHDEPLYEIAPQIAPIAFCSLCNKTFNGPLNFKQHQESKQHKKSLSKFDLINNLKQNNQVNETLESSDEDILFFHCADCNKNFTRPLPYKQHLISKSHKKNVKNMEYLNKLKEFDINILENGPLSCKLCNKSFSGPIPFKAHLKSDVHEKLEKKYVIMQDLTKNYPEMHCFDSSMLSSRFLENIYGNDKNFEDSQCFLTCTICYKSFSGPESAKEHFRSRKHYKAKLKHDKLKCLKKQQERNKTAANKLISQLKLKEQTNSDYNIIQNNTADEQDELNKLFSNNSDQFDFM